MGVWPPLSSPHRELPEFPVTSSSGVPEVWQVAGLASAPFRPFWRGPAICWGLGGLMGKGQTHRALSLPFERFEVDGVELLPESVVDPSLVVLSGIEG